MIYGKNMTLQKFVLLFRRMNVFNKDLLNICYLPVRACESLNA